MSEATIHQLKRRITELEALNKEAREWLLELKAEWGWKKDERAGNAEQYEQLEQLIERMSK